jgi:hypothetical protein
VLKGAQLVNDGWAPVLVISGAGDRRDEDIRDQTRILGTAFDTVLLYQDACQRGREDGEVLGLLREGLVGAERTREIEEIRGEFDFVLIDCPPSLSVLTLNGLCLADEVVVPMQAQFLAMQGLTKLLETVEILTQSLNPTLKVGGVVLCMHETQTSHSREVVQELSNFFDESAGSGLPWDGAKVFMPAVRWASARLRR